MSARSSLASARTHRTCLSAGPLHQLLHPLKQEFHTHTDRSTRPFNQRLLRRLGIRSVLQVRALLLYNAHLTGLMWWAFPIAGLGFCAAFTAFGQVGTLLLVVPAGRLVTTGTNRTSKIHPPHGSHGKESGAQLYRACRLMIMVRISALAASAHCQTTQSKQNPHLPLLITHTTYSPAF